VKAAVDLDLLGEIGDVAFLEAVELEAAAKRLQLADDPLEQRRLACAVRSDDGEKLAFGDLAGDVVHGRMAVIAEREIAEGDGLWTGRHDQANAQNTADHNSIAATATMTSRAVSERPSSEKLEICVGSSSAPALSTSETSAGAAATSANGRRPSSRLPVRIVTILCFRPASYDGRQAAHSPASSSVTCSGTISSGASPSNAA
jgi:hypothetical protein